MADQQQESSASSQSTSTTAESLCVDQPQLMRIYFVYAIPILCTLSAILLCICLAFYIVAYIEKKLKIGGIMFASTSLFFVVTLLNFVSWSIMSFHYCANQLIYNMSVPISLFLNITKGLFLVAILFRTVRTVFKGTPFALSQCTIIFFRCLFSLSCVLIVCAGVMFPANRRMLGFAMSGSSQTLSDILSIYLVGVFIHKLMQTHGDMDCASDDNKSKQLVGIITKIAILFSIATATRIAVTVSSASLTFMHNVHYSLFYNVLIIVDLHTNFFCLFLCYKCFDPMYSRLCGLCDRCCHRCWLRCMTRKQTKDEQMIVAIQRVGTESAMSKTNISLPATTKCDTCSSMETDTRSMSVAMEKETTLTVTVTASSTGSSMANGGPGPQMTVDGEQDMVTTTEPGMQMNCHNVSV